MHAYAVHQHHKVLKEVLRHLSRGKERVELLEQRYDVFLCLAQVRETPQKLSCENSEVINLLCNSKRTRKCAVWAWLGKRHAQRGPVRSE